MSGPYFMPDQLGLALVGYRGTGKTTVGYALAEMLNRRFVDADLEVEAWRGRSIRAIFEEEGEAAFRDLEERVIAQLTTFPAKKVLATGGGAVLRASNRDALKRYGFVVWLRADPSVLAERLRTDTGRPALTAAGTLAEIAAVLAEREPLYREVADVEIDTDGRKPIEVMLEIVQKLQHTDRATWRVKRKGR